MGDGTIEASFSLWVPSLHYHFPFMRAVFTVDPIYPVTLVVDKMADVKVNDEAELTAALGKIFSAPSTVMTIQRLISVAKK